MSLSWDSRCRATAIATSHHIVPATSIACFWALLTLVLTLFPWQCIFVVYHGGAVALAVAREFAVSLAVARDFAVPCHP